MSGHPQFEEDFDLYELNMLEPAERTEIESHLADCMDCRARLDQARERLALAALSVPQIDPPARVRDRLMHQVREDSVAARSRSAKPVRFWQRQQFVWGFAAAMILIAALSVARNIQLRREIRESRLTAQTQQAELDRSREVLDLLTGSDTQVVNLAAASEKPQPYGKVYYHRPRGLLFTASNLSAPAAGRTYQLWLVPAQGAPISAAVFDPDEKGNASIVLPDLPTGVAVKAFAVTVEPAGGVSQPTGPKILIGAAS